MEAERGAAPLSGQLEGFSVNSTAEPASSLWNSSAASQMAPEERFRIVRSVGEECIEDDELMTLLTKKPQPVCYDGFEPSGRMHIAQIVQASCFGNVRGRLRGQGKIMVKLNLDGSGYASDMEC